MRKTILTLGVASALVATALYAAKGTRSVQHQDGEQQDAKGRPKVDLVIALDTSGSMDGLINAARQKLWDLVNEVGRAKPTPVLRVGLVTYGSEGTEQDGYVVIRSKLTTDLDAIYSKLFELRTNGGTEYVGRAVYRSVKELNWDQDSRTLKQIFVAGNESADQDQRVRASAAVKLARQQGIFVNTIHCGYASSGEREGWQEVAKLGNGVFAAIDHNHGTVLVSTPYDAKINALSARLNGTYVGYGRAAAEGAAMQAAQDKNAEKAHASAGAARAVAKASGLYRNDRWDLVDARKAGKLDGIRSEDLPEKLRKLGKKELNSELDKLEKERESLRKEIVALSKQRDAYLAAEKKKKGLSEDKAFDHAVKRAIRVQAASKKIRFE